MCFGDPWEGDVPVDQVVDAGRRLLDLGAYQLSLGDTIGVGTAGPRHRAARRVQRRRASPDDRLAVHFHDTYGQALANAYAALAHGVTTFDASAGGLGGCPYAESATGNLATEDLVWMLHGLGDRDRRRPRRAGGDQPLAGRTPRPPQPEPGGQRPRLTLSLGGCGTIAAMADVVYLHVGAPKTGTTYLQDRLLHNRDALAAHGVHYPVGLRRDMFGGGARPHRPAVGRPARGGPRRVGRADRPGPRAHGHRGGQPRDPRRRHAPSRSTRAMRDLGDAEVHVVYSARDLARQIPAEWQESVKHRDGSRSAVPRQ